MSITCAEAIVVLFLGLDLNLIAGVWGINPFELCRHPLHDVIDVLNEPEDVVEDRVAVLVYRDYVERICEYGKPRPLLIWRFWPGVKNVKVRLGEVECGEVLEHLLVDIFHRILRDPLQPFRQQNIHRTPGRCVTVKVDRAHGWVHGDHDLFVHEVVNHKQQVCIAAGISTRTC